MARPGGTFGDNLFDLPLHPAPKGRRIDPDARAEVRRILGDAPRRRDLLLDHLHRLQDEIGHIPYRHLLALATELRLAPVEVYEVATFYQRFDVVADDESPPPSPAVGVCGSLPCRLAGAGELRDGLHAVLGADGRVEELTCLGRCASAPVARVGDRAIDDATPAAVAAAVDAGRTQPDVPAYPGYGEYRAAGGYGALEACLRGERPVADVVDAIDAAGLRGLGGAGFPVARKWRMVRDAPTPRAMVLNADESEPGTFKDRYCLETDPHRVLEGMLIAAWAVGADDVQIYLRDEYAAARRVLERELAALEADPPAELPAVRLRRGAGNYICGEETALLESLEGRRGEPRLRPPYPARIGLSGRPTLVQNVETVYWLREILERGGDAFAARGTNGAKGERLFSVSGRVARPGVHRAPAGTTARRLIDEFAGGMAPGHELYAFLPGGASGGIFPASMADLPLDFGALEPHGGFVGTAGVIVLSTADRASDAALDLMRFFARESCGKCTPCRNGTAKAVRIMEADRWRSDLLEALGTVMADASICGLGQAAPNAVWSVLRHFPEEIEREERES